jgi:outer membrane protein TolC
MKRQSKARGVYTAAGIGRVLIAAALVSTSLCSYAADGPSRPHIEMSRQQCIANALENNLDIKISTIDPLSAAAGVTEARGAFDPQLSGRLINGETFSAGGIRSFEGVTFNLGPTKEPSLLGVAGLTGLAPTGTSYELAYRTYRSDTQPGISPTRYRSSTELTLTQSLLRGLGLDVNRTQIRIAAINKEISESALERVVMETVASVQNAYWDLVFTREDLEVKTKSLVVAEDLLDRNRRRLEIGAAARFEVDQAEAGVAVREADIIAAEASVRFAEDQLKFVMNLRDDVEYWDMEIVPTDNAEVVAREVNLDQEIERAFEMRPEIMQARKNIESADVNLVYARNQVLPQVDFTASYGFNSQEQSRSREIEYLLRADHYSYSYGLIGSVPIGNRSAQARRTNAGHTAKKAKLTLEALKKRTAIEVREAVRAVTTNLKLVEANGATRELREKTLEDEQTRYEVGVSTSYQVLEIEEDVAEARSAELSAVVNYRKSLVNLDLVDGAILDKNNIEWTTSAE